MADLSHPKRQLLIVEDDRDINEANKYWCEMAAFQAQTQGLNIECEVNQAFTFQEAVDIINRTEIDFLSIDLALDRREEERNNPAQAGNLNPGGMRLLELLEHKKQNGGSNTSTPLVVIKSGETSQNYMRDAWLKYGVLTFFQKDRADDTQYMNTVISVLWYQEALRIAHELRTAPRVEDVEAMLPHLETCLHHASDAASEADIPERSFPVAISGIQQDVEQLFRHPVTKLPTGDWTASALFNHVIPGDVWSGQPEKRWAILCLVLAGFHKLMTQVSSQEEQILVHTLHSIESICSEAGFEPGAYFLGNLGGMYSTAEPRFILIFNEAGIGSVQSIADAMKHEFDGSAHKFGSEFDPRLAGEQFPLKAVIKTWTSDENADDFADWHKVLDMLGQI
ncbi:MAG TPA: hypothetical protein VHL11_05205 [Phototrophicaceae bacterium]|jgi:CheY-like chemotaxis protein|nr:hypothetical protein [Phototrophicaceae bacterium]